VAAIFLLVVLAALGIVATRIGNGQQTIADLRILQSRASRAADAGREWGLARVMTSGCPLANPTLIALSQDLAGFTISVDCQTPAAGEYVITSKASSGVYGSPLFVQRIKTARYP
jgi:MSHA biogenesis protein MshP